MLRLLFLALAASLLVLIQPVRAEEAATDESASPSGIVGNIFELQGFGEPDMKTKEELDNLMAIIEPALQAFIAAPEGEGMLTDPGFSIAPLYHDASDEPTAFWGLLFMRAPSNPFGEPRLCIQFNQPDEGYPIVTLSFHSEINLLKGAGDTYQVVYTPVQQQ